MNLQKIAEECFVNEFEKLSSRYSKELKKIKNMIDKRKIVGEHLKEHIHGKFNRTGRSIKFDIGTKANEVGYEMANHPLMRAIAMIKHPIKYFKG